MVALLCALAGLLLQPRIGIAGGYIFAGEGNGVDLVFHPTPYTGSGGTVNVSVCIHPASPNAAAMEISVRNIVHAFNELVPTTGNLVFNSANNIPSGQVDFESVALHEVGHCIGLAHVNLASESGLPTADQEYTKSTDGLNNVYDVAIGADGVRGSADDLRGDDVNLHYFNKLTNDPFQVSAVVDSTTYSRDTAQLPGSDSYAANAERLVAALLGVPNTESVMQQGTGADEAQRTLTGDDVATLRYGMSGVDELEGTADDYALVLSYVGLTPNCDVLLDFDNSQSSFAACYTTGALIASDHGRITSAEAYFNTDYSWFFNDELASCGNGSLDAGEACDDGNNQGGDCCSANCQFEAAAGSCDDEVLCFEGSCDGAGSCIQSGPYDCEDGLFCNGAEVCTVSVGCEAGTPVVVDDGVTCTDDSCDEVLDLVVNTAVDANCDDGQFCNGLESCDALLDCQAGTAVDVDDGVTCTDDSCDEVLDLVVNAEVDANCDDGQFCNGLESCDALLDCQAGTAVDVDDGVGCTDDSCDEMLDLVVNAAVDANCDDSQFCNGPEICDALLDCQAGTAVAVDDGVTCTDDSCDEGLDLVVNAAVDSNCDDGQFCNGPESCDPVLDCQAGMPPDISDGVGCTYDTCSETFDVAVHQVNSALCSDDLFCNGVEICDLLLDCQPGTPVDVDDGFECTHDSCSESQDRVLHAADWDLCEDGDPETTGVCDPQQGCVFLHGENLKGVPSSMPLARLGIALVLCLVGAGAVARARRRRR